MRGGGHFASFLVLILASCGLETVPSLQDPPARYSDQTLVTNSRLSLIHDASLYSGTSFLAYVVYYKIYAVADTDTFARLLEDRSKLSSSPTVNQLMSLGYQQLTGAGSISGVGARNLEIQPSGNGTKVTLAFDDFLASGSDAVQPELLLNEVSEGPTYLFRSTNLGETLGFGALRTEKIQRSDMATMTPEHLSTKREYEVNIFVAAYGYTDTLTEVYSTPVPWGVIRTIQP